MQLQTNLSLKGIKAPRVTGSTTKLESYKKTQEKKEKKGKRQKRRAAFETQKMDGLFSDSLLCQFQECGWLLSQTGCTESRFLGSASLSLCPLELSI